MSKLLFEAIIEENKLPVRKQLYIRFMSRSSRMISSEKMIKGMSFEEIMLYRRESDGYSVFHLLVELREFSLLKLLLKKYQASDSAHLINFYNKEGDTPLGVLIGNTNTKPCMSNSDVINWCKLFINSTNTKEKLIQILSLGDSESISIIWHIASKYPSLISDIFDKIEFLDIPISLIPCSEDNILFTLTIFEEFDLYYRALNYIKKRKHPEDIDCLCYLKQDGSTILQRAIIKNDIDNSLKIIEVVKETQDYRLFIYLDNNGYTALQQAIINKSNSVVNAILSSLNNHDKMRIINNYSFDTKQREQQENPLYQALSMENDISAKLLLDTKCCFLNPLELPSLFRFMRGNTIIRNKLRKLGCLEEATHSKVQGNQLGIRLTQDKQGIHMPYAEITIKESLERLKSNTQFNIDEKFDHFIDYCTENNSDFINDIMSLKLNSETFSLASVREGLSELSDHERVTFLINLVIKRINDFSSYSEGLKNKFKERIALLWGSIFSNDSHIYNKFQILKEGDSPAKRQKLRNILFACLIQTRFEYERKFDEFAEEDLIQCPILDEFPDAKGKGKVEAMQKVKFSKLLRSRPACVFGLLNYLIEAFSDKHDDIIVREVKIPVTDDNNRVNSQSNPIDLNKIVIHAFIDDECVLSQVIDNLRSYGDDANSLTEADIVQYCTIGQILDIDGNMRLEQTLFIGRFLGLLKKVWFHHKVTLQPNLVIEPGRERELMEAFYVFIEEAIQKLTKNELITILLNAQREYLLHQLNACKLDKEIGEMAQQSELHLFMKTQFENTNYQNEHWYLKLSSSSKQHLDRLLKRPIEKESSDSNLFLPSSSNNKSFEPLSQSLQTASTLIKKGDDEIVSTCKSKHSVSRRVL